MPGTNTRHTLRLIVGMVCLSTAAGAAVQVTPPSDALDVVVQQFERAVNSGDAAAYLSLLAPGADKDKALADTAGLFEAGATRVAIKQQDRVCEQDVCHLVVDVLREYGARGQLSTWRLDLRRDGADGRWAIAGQQSLSNVVGLFKLSLDRSPAKAYRARGVTIEAEDVSIRMTDGSVFVAEAAGRATAFVFVGKGEMTFAPAPAAERGQTRIFCGSERLQTPVDAIFVRVNPNEVGRHIKGLGEPQPDLRDLKRAEDVFRESDRLSFAVDLPGLSNDPWTLVPHEGDFVAEISTKRYGQLTFSLAPSEPEDVLLFDRKTRRNVAQYASRARLSARGLFYDDSAHADYEVTHYDVNARFTPSRDWMEATVRMSVVVRAGSVSSFTLRLADTLAIREVTSPQLGRLLPLRVHGREAFVVNLPSVVTRGTRLTLAFAYAGVVRSQRLDRDIMRLDAAQIGRGDFRPGPLPSYTYTNRPFWYPQPAFGGFATATLRVAVPPPFAVVASGARLVTPADTKSEPALEAAGFRSYVFSAERPVQYLSLVIAPLVPLQSERASATARAGVDGAAAGTTPAAVDISVQTNPPEKGLARDLYARVSDIVEFYSRLLGSSPYPALNVVLVEQDLPGGHSPAYMAAINHVSGRDTPRWRDDPGYVDGFPEYVVAHEVAHQWWGQAVGTKNYHEQWLSEAFAQYFSALYAEHAHDAGLFQDIVRSWQRWVSRESDQGPVYLGYRVGHIKADGRAYRAIVYDKGALVLQMLRQLVGDDAFFRGLRRFYGEFRFRKAGTDDLQRAMEAESGTSLDRFFQGWIHGDALPIVRVSMAPAAGGRELLVRVEQEGQPFDLPLVVSLDYSDRPPARVTMRVNQSRQELRIPLAGKLRKADPKGATAAVFARLSVRSSGLAP